MRLVITEKFSTARIIAAALSSTRHLVGRENGYFTVGQDAVIWTGGALIELAPPEAYDEKFHSWRLEHLPIFPDWKWVERQDHAEQLTALRRVLREADTIVHAGANDREGQWHIDELLEYLRISHAVPVKRLLMEDLNVSAVRTALHSLHDNHEFAALSSSARARSHADWLYGINMTRAYTLLGRHSGHEGVLSIGRVQTPVLALVVARDESIEQFKAHTVFDLSVKIIGANDGRYCHARWQSSAEGGSHPDRTVVEALAKKILNAPGRVLSREVKEINEAPPLPYDLSSLHIDGANTFGYSASEVEDACRQLYEKHHVISYPFVDCRYLPEEKLAQASETIETMLSVLHHNFSQRDTWLEEKIRQADCWLKRAGWNNSKLSGQHAILPVEKTSDKMMLTAVEENVYRLIVKNHVAQFYPDHQYVVQKIVFGLADDCFLHEAIQIIQKGWKSLYPDNDHPSGSPVKRVREYDAWLVDEAIRCEDVTIREKLTRPPDRFTEATLIDAMSHLSAHVSRAATLEGLVKRGYLMQGSHHLFSTQLGKDLVHALPELDLLQSSLPWETRLSDIAAGRLTYEHFMLEFQRYLAELIAQVRQKKIMTLTSTDKILGLPTEEKFTCPRCQAVLLLRHGKHGDFWGCSRYPECKHTLPDHRDAHGKNRPDFRVDESHLNKPLQKRLANPLKKNCPVCGKPLVRRQGKRGAFAGCSAYPQCTHTEALHKHDP